MRAKAAPSIVSSVAVEKPVRDWPHYVAAKNAVEGLGLVAPLQYPDTGCLIIRPDKLLTDMTNTPMGRQNAMSPSVFCRRKSVVLSKRPLRLERRECFTGVTVNKAFQKVSSVVTLKELRMTNGLAEL